MDQPDGGFGAHAGGGSAFVVVRTYPDVPTAEIDRGLLEHHGIPAYLEDANTAAMDGLLTSAIGWVKLLVPTPERERAVRLLGHPPLAEDDPEPPERCPRCAAEEIGTVRPYAAFAFLTLVFPLLLPLLPVALPLALIKRRYCAACGLRWK